ncbi:MAG: molybdopterin molybdotransferase MoeA [Cyanophyceae cyanobacterium]
MAMAQGQGTDGLGTRLLKASEAIARILSLAMVVDWRETVPLGLAAGRVLAEPVRSRLDFPHWDNSAMDGYGIRAADVGAARPDQPVILDVIEEIPAGRAPTRSLGPGQAVRIYTGAMLPEGADAIAIQEEVTVLPDGRVAIPTAIAPDTFVRKRGAFGRSGDEILAAGTRLGPAEVALLAAAQCAQVTVFRKPRVAILSTGDELVAVDGPTLKPGQIVDSNRYALEAFIQQMGGEAIALGIIPDDRAALKTAMERAIVEADLVLSTGGVSVGTYDYVETLLEELGAAIAIRSVAVKPGKPLTVATVPKGNGSNPGNPCLYFGLPGNPASALVGCWRFVAPALKKMAGESVDPEAGRLRCIAAAMLPGAGQREAYLWGRIALRDGQYHFIPALGGHNSGNLVNLVGTTALAIVPVGAGAIAAGDPVEVLTLS